MTPSKELLTKLSQLEAVERRWLLSIFSSLILSSILLALALGHLNLGAITRGEWVRVPPTQFLIMTVLLALILASSIMVIVEYFAFELRIERAVVIKKRRKRSYEQDINERGV